MIDWHQTTLVDDLARRRCVIIIGSGVSRHSSGENGKRGKFPGGYAGAAMTSWGSHGTGVAPWTPKRSPRNW